LLVSETSGVSIETEVAGSNPAPPVKAGANGILIRDSFFGVLNEGVLLLG